MTTFLSIATYWVTSTVLSAYEYLASSNCTHLVMYLFGRIVQRSTSPTARRSVQKRLTASPTICGVRRGFLSIQRSLNLSNSLCSVQRGLTSLQTVRRCLSSAAIFRFQPTVLLRHRHYSFLSRSPRIANCKLYRQAIQVCVYTRYLCSYVIEYACTVTADGTWAIS